MKILVLGGTRFLGIHLVEHLIRDRHQVTVATRGNAKHPFGDQVRHLVTDRQDRESLKSLFEQERYDVICDNICYTSNDVANLLDTAACGRYVMTSTMSVYPLSQFHDNLTEDEFDPASYPLKWCSRKDAPYDETKRQAEAALFQKYASVPAAAVRLPYVIGEDDYTNRLYFYVEHVVRGLPMYIDNLDAKMSFVFSQDAGAFLAWLAGAGFTGSINGANGGRISMKEVISYVEEKTGRKAQLSPEGDSAPYNGTPAYALNTDLAQQQGFQFRKTDGMITQLLDTYIQRAEREEE